MIKSVHICITHCKK